MGLIPGLPTDLAKQMQDTARNMDTTVSLLNNVILCLDVLIRLQREANDLQRKQHS